MSVITEVWIPGVAKTKGSLTFRGHHAVENVKGSAAWRMLIVGAVRADLRARYPRHVEANEPIARATTPIQVCMTVFTPGDPLDISAGDLDKLARNALDALSWSKPTPEELAQGELPKKSAGAYADDRQVASLIARKMRAGSPDKCGMALRVSVDDM